MAALARWEIENEKEHRYASLPGNVCACETCTKVRMRKYPITGDFVRYWERARRAKTSGVRLRNERQAHRTYNAMTEAARTMALRELRARHLHYYRDDAE